MKQDRKIATLVAFVALSLTMPPTGMERPMAIPIVTRQILQVEQIKIETTKTFADVEAALETNIPELDLAIRDALVGGDEQRATELERGAPLFIFLRRDHGAREKSAKREKMSPEEKMKPVAAREATRLLTARPLGAIIATKKLMRDKQRILNRMDEEDSVFAQRLKTAEIAPFAERRPPNFPGLAS